MLSPRGQFRMGQWEASGGLDGQTPYHQCRRADVPGWESQRVPPPPGSAEARLLRDLRAIDSGFEIIKLLFTAMSPDAPCHHLYLRTGGQGSDPEDVLTLQFSLQWDVTRPWADGEPRAPGPWLVGVVRRYDRARVYGDREAALKGMAAESDSAYESAWVAAQTPLVTFENEVNEMFRPYLRRGRVVPHYLWTPPTRAPRKLTSVVLPKDGSAIAGAKGVTSGE